MAGPQIVQVNVSVQVAPSPSTLQQTGAFISQGATTATPNSLTLLTQLSDLTTGNPALLAGASALTNLSWSGGVVTATAASTITDGSHGNLTIGDTVTLTIVGATPNGYNGTFLCTVSGASSFTYTVVSNPGTMSSPGTFTPEDVAELLAMATTFFAQGQSVSAYVLELGMGSVNEGVANLTTWLANNPKTVYSYLVPRSWDANANFLALIGNNESPSALSNFFVTTTTSTYSNYTSLMNNVVEAPEYLEYPPNFLPFRPFRPLATSWDSPSASVFFRR